MSADSQSEPPPVLGWVAAAAPGLWFVADSPADLRDAARDLVWELCRGGRVEVGDWVPGRGQGFRLAADAVATVTPSAPATQNAVARRLLDPPPAVVTPLLVVVHVAWFVAGGLVAARTRAATDYLAGTAHPIIHPILLRTGAVSAGELLGGGWWRLLTCGFVHVGLFHLLGNVVILAVLGGLAEGVWGRWRFLLIYLLAGVAAGTTAMALHPLSADGETVYGSASGGLWGVTAAVLAWLARNLKDAPPAAVADAARRVAIVGVMNLVVSLSKGVSVAGLVGGAAGGLLAAWGLNRLRENRREAVAGLLGGAVGFVGLLVTAVFVTNDWQTVRERAAPKPPPAAVAPAAP